MDNPRPIGEIISEIMSGLCELQDRYNKDCGDDILSCKAAAKYLGRTSATISRYIAEGRLTKVVEAGVTGIRKSELRRLK